MPGLLQEHVQHVFHFIDMLTFGESEHFFATTTSSSHSPKQLMKGKNRDIIPRISCDSFKYIISFFFVISNPRSCKERNQSPKKKRNEASGGGVGEENWMPMT